MHPLRLSGSGKKEAKLKAEEALNKVNMESRVTYVADRPDKVVYIFDSQRETQRHADEALKIFLLLKRTGYVHS